MSRPRASRNTESINPRFAKNLRTLRHLRDVKQDELGATLGWPNGTIGFIERCGRDITLTEAHAIAAYFGYDIDEMATQDVIYAMSSKA